MTGRDKLAERFPEYREAVEMSDQKIETSLADLMKKVDEEGQGGSGGGRPDANISDEAKQYAAAVVSGLDDDKVLGQGLFASMLGVWNKEAPAIAPSAGEAIQDAGIYTPRTFGPTITRMGRRTIQIQSNGWTNRRNHLNIGQISRQ